MNDYIQYHKIHEYGRPTSTQGDFKAYTDKSVDEMVGNRVWLISGEKQLSKYLYCLEYMFVVDAVAEGNRNVMTGTQGKLLTKPIHLNGYPWFEALKKKNQNFRFGLSRIEDEIIEALERLIGLRGGFDEL